MRRENKISCREFRRGKNILPTTRLLEKKILADQKSFLRTRSRPFCIFSMTTLPITLLPTGNNVTPRQFLHSFKSPRFGIFTIKPFFHWSGIFSSALSTPLLPHYYLLCTALLGYHRFQVFFQSLSSSVPASHTNPMRQPLRVSFHF